MLCTHTYTILIFVHRLELDEHGNGTVIITAEFPDLSLKYGHSHTHGHTSERRNVYAMSAYHVIYHLTPIGASMPNLHVLSEVGWFKGLGSYPSYREITGSGAPRTDLKDVKNTQSFASPSSSGALSTAAVPLSSASADDYNNTAAANRSLSSTTTHRKVAAAMKKSKSTPDHSKILTEPGNDDVIAPVPPADVAASSTTTCGTGIAPQGWWESVQTNTQYTDSPSARQKNITSMQRSSSTGDLPNILHNDRLIDGPILGSLPLLGPNGLVETYRKQFTRKKTTATPAASYTTTFNGTTNTNNTTTKTSNSNIEHHQNTPTSKLEKGHNSDLSDRPICFTVSGGAPRGTVSWLIKTVPVAGSSNKPNNGNKSTRALYSGGDWRTIPTS